MNRWFRVCWVCFYVTSAQSRHARHYTVSEHAWKNSTGPFANVAVVLTDASAVEVVEEAMQETVSNVYFLRHGQNVGNKWVEEHHSMFPHTAEYVDGGLTELGMRQAVHAQDVLGSQLSKEPAASIQLAASLSARAFDTLVVASAPLWKNWVAEGTPFMLQGVPAAMELDLTINTDRKSGVGENDPVRWQDSALRTLDNLSNAEGASALFYNTSNTSVKTTRKPVEVQTFYARDRSDVRFSTCEGAGLDHLESYLAATAAAGKKHIILGTHGTALWCMMTRYASPWIVPVASGNGTLHDLVEGKFGEPAIANGAVLHVRMHRIPDRPILLEPVLLYNNPLLSH